MKTNGRIPESELPDLPHGWEWESSGTEYDVPCWDARTPLIHGHWVHVWQDDGVQARNAPAEVVALVKYANGLGPDPREPAKRDHCTLAIALLTAALDDNEDPRIEAAIALLEEA